MMKYLPSRIIIYKNAFNWFEEEGRVEGRYIHFRLMDLTREELYVMGESAILEEE